MQPRLTRSRADRMIAGVCGGLGHYFGIDPVIVRLIFVVLAFTTFITPLVYPVLWLIMPEEGSPQAGGAQASIGLPRDARFDPMTGQPLPPQATESQQVTGQTVKLPPSPQPQSAPGNRSRTLGMLLLGIGAIVLLNNVGDALAQLFGIDLSNLVFPALLVGLGIYLLRKRTV